MVKNMVNEELIKLASKEDIPILQNIFEDNWKNMYLINYPSKLVELVLFNDNTSDAWNKSFDLGNMHFLLRNSNQYVAMAGLSGMEVIRVGTLTEHGGKGHGKKLMNYIFDHSKEVGLPYLWCDSSLQAISFYEKLGFQKTEDLVKNVYDVEMPMQRMLKKLGEDYE
jgi:GNAT superfamily N-acetyltransferase